MYIVIDLLKLSLRDGIEVKKALSEFLTIKILNAELPVMIMLAYRYGLRRMLDYIGIEYYITENRSKIIVSESTPATESFGVNSDRVAGSDELEILYGKDWIKPRNDSKPNIVITNRRAEQDETDYEILQNDRNKNDLTYSLPGAEDFINSDNGKADDLWDQLNGGMLIGQYLDPHPEYLKTVKEAVDYAHQVIKKYDEGDLFLYSDDSWYREVRQKYHITGKEQCNYLFYLTYTGSCYCCTGNTIPLVETEWQMGFKCPDNIKRAMRECVFGKIFIWFDADHFTKKIAQNKQGPKYLTKR